MMIIIRDIVDQVYSFKEKLIHIKQCAVENNGMHACIEHVMPIARKFEHKHIKCRVDV